MGFDRTTFPNSVGNRMTFVRHLAPEVALDLLPRQSVVAVPTLICRQLTTLRSIYFLSILVLGGGLLYWHAAMQPDGKIRRLQPSRTVLLRIPCHRDVRTSA